MTSSSQPVACLRIAQAAVLALALAFSGSARADGPGDPSGQAARSAAARALFKQGRQFVAVGKYQQACSKFEESLRLESGIGTRFNLADCWQRVGRLASAWALFLDVVADARAAGQTEREAVATARAQELESRVSYVIVNVTAPVPGQRVFLGGLELGPAAWGTPWPADPGSHQVRVEAEGYVTVNRQVYVPNEGQSTRVRLGPLQPVSSNVEAASAHASAPVDQTPLTNDLQQSGLALSSVGIASLGLLGVAGVGLGTYFIMQRNVANEQASLLCRGDQDCTVGQIEAHAKHLRQVRKFGTASAWSFGTGGAAIVGAAVWYFARTEPASEVARISTLHVESTQGGMYVGYSRAW